MTQEDKKLLLKDLCARLLYGVVVETQLVNVPRAKYPVLKVLQSYMLCDFMQTIENVIHKPYLRPMSSMTEEESNELESFTFPLMEKDWDGNENPACIRWIDIPKCMDFILSHHFDYQGLIPKGLAIEVTKENNPYKD